MGNSFHSDNPICPVNVIMPDPKFLTPFRSRQIQRPSPLKSVSRFYSAVLWSVQIGRVRANSDFGKVRTQSERYSRVCRTENFPVGTAQKSAGDHSRMSFGGKGMPEAVTSEGALEKVNERENCVGLKMEIV